MVIVLVPTANPITPDAVFDVTPVPFTVIVAVASAADGVTVTEEVVVATVAV